VHTSHEEITDRLRLALTGSISTPLVLLGNFEVEDQWAIGEPGLPRIPVMSGRAVVNRMDELALLLAGPGDAVVLKSAPDPGYLEYLAELGLGVPRTLTVADQDPQKSVTEDALDDAGLAPVLTELGRSGAQLWPHGVSTAEERLAARGGLALAAPPTSVCKRVNSKIYSRLLADRLGLRQPPGRCCRNREELAQAADWVRTLLSAGKRAVFKDAYGVSGKGILVVESEQKLDRLVTMIERAAVRSGEDRLELVVEEWVPKSADLNYQFHIDRTGETCFDFVKEAITDAGVHLGHRMPARLSSEQVRQVESSAQAIGARLAADGYFGVVGVDALVEPDGGVYPVLEINARNNMSTYQERLRQRFVRDGQTALAMQYPLRLPVPMPFADLRRTLGELLLAPGKPTGFLINAFATVNAGAPAKREPDGGTFHGRLYGITVGDSFEHAAGLDREVRSRLATVTEGGRRAS